MHLRVLEAVEVQSMSPKNMLPWYIDYFETKALEKQQIQNGYSDFPSSP